MHKPSPTQSHEIPYWSPIEASQVREVIDEALAKKKYAEMMADAQFPPGAILELEV